MKTNGLKTLMASLVAIVICFTMLLGTTFAWFTDSVSSSNNIIASGLLDINTYWMEGGQDPTDEYNWIEFNGSPIFNYEKWEPGYVEAKHLKITNDGTLAFKYKLVIAPNGEVSDLADVIDVYYFPTATKLNAREEVENGVKVGTLADLITDPDGAAYGILLPVGTTPNDPEKEIVGSVSVSIAFKMQENASVEYQGKSIGTSFDINVYATQYNFEEDTFGNDYDNDSQYNTPSKWDGTLDTSWYNDTDTEFTLTTAQQLAGFAKLLDESEMISFFAGEQEEFRSIFYGKTIKLDRDFDLAGQECFEPIGSYRNDKFFDGTFDGQGHTISNLSQTTWALDNGYYYDDLGLGLFGAVQNATIKNLKIDNAFVSGENGLCGIVAATAFGDCTFENITITNSDVADYQYYAGGIVGWASGNQTYKGIVVDESNVIGGQWGDFANANGGIIGGASTSGTYHFEDCTIACRIDAVNDVVSAYQWYCYRNCGMIIGKIDDYVKDEVTNVVAENVTCENVTVIYNDWANYTYCEFAGTGYPYVRVQAGTSVDAYTNIRYGHPTDANGNIVVDDNHVHNDGEAHHELIEFDQLFGGPANQRYCYYGIAEHPGVTVVYNNK